MIDNPTTPEDGAQLLHRLRLAIAKARSNSIESFGEQMTRDLTPEVMSDSLLNGALDRLEGKTPTWNTLNNVLTLAHRCPLIVASYAIRWENELLEQYTFKMYEGGDA